MSSLDQEISLKKLKIPGSLRVKQEGKEGIIRFCEGGKNEFGFQCPYNHGLTNHSKKQREVKK
jgi:hypothetical protein